MVHLTLPFIAWRVQDYSFVIWVLAAVFSSLYTSAWDLFVDWGLLRPRYAYLRESLGFPAHKNVSGWSDVAARPRAHAYCGLFPALLRGDGETLVRIRKRLC